MTHAPVTRTLFELAGADDACRFSPYGWRAVMALAHKGLDVDRQPWRFTEKDKIAFSGQGRTPVLIDGDETVVDSWTIALHLDQAYPDRPRLFAADQARAHAQLIRHWTETALQPALMRIILLDVFACLHEQDKDYFRSSREKMFGKSLEEVALGKAGLEALQTALVPLRRTLAEQPFLGGTQASFADYLPFGAFMWARVTSPIDLLQPDDPIHDWRERLLDAFDGLARQTPSASER